MEHEPAAVGIFISWPPRTSGPVRFVGPTITLLTFLVFAGVAAVLERGKLDVTFTWVASETFEWRNLGMGMVLLVPFVLAHELVHAAAFRACGARPRIWVVFRGRLPRYLCVSAEGTRFSRNAFFVIIAAPLVVITLVGLGLMISVPALRLACVFAMTVHQDGCMCDLRMLHMLYGLSSSAAVTDREGGIQVQFPTPSCAGRATGA
jgi:hypothetical protein